MPAFPSASPSDTLRESLQVSESLLCVPPCPAVTSSHASSQKQEPTTTTAKGLPASCSLPCRNKRCGQKFQTKKKLTSVGKYLCFPHHNCKITIVEKVKKKCHFSVCFVHGSSLPVNTLFLSSAEKTTQQEKEKGTAELKIQENPIQKVDTRAGVVL